MTHIGYLKKLSLWWQEHEVDNSELVLEIKLGPVALSSWQRGKEDSYEDVTLKFSGVRSLKIGEIQMLSVAQIEMYDVSNQQLEGINLKVVEEENSLFSFLCGAIQIN
jgi:hypothetical protein